MIVRNPPELVCRLSMYCAGVRAYVTVVETVPQIIIRTGHIRQDGQEEVLTEYMCDVPGCPNIAEHVIGVSVELGAAFVVCATHALAQARQVRHTATRPDTIGRLRHHLAARATLEGFRSTLGTGRGFGSA